MRQGFDQWTERSQDKVKSRGELLIRADPNVLIAPHRKASPINVNPAKAAVAPTRHHHGTDPDTSLTPRRSV